MFGIQSFALLLAMAAQCREVRSRRALQSLLLGMLPVVLCLLLKSLRDDAAAGQELSEILVRELSSDSQLLLPAPPPAARQALPHRSQLLSPSEHRRLPF